MKKLKKNKKIGLALGGGAVLGAAHIGVLKALKEHDISISYVSGTSIGAFVSAFVAFQKTWEEVEEITKDLNWLDISGISLSKFGLLANKKLGELITDHVGDVNFEDAKIPVAMMATDITSGDKVVLNKGNLAQAVMASTCIPGIFVPVEIENKLLVDGGIVENVPITPLEDMGAQVTIGVDLNAEHLYKKPENIIEVMLRSFDFLIKTATELQTAKADILIKPDLSDFNMVDIEQADDLIKVGYKEATKILQKVT
ncbi:MAG: patatin-like phospholipase family protein [candidate division KSB1 bacterium]|nr:patatin-like phospholipase family protein [candidate division KSB1 bacterium]